MQATLDDMLKNLFVNRVSLSDNKGLCTVYFYTVKGEEYFNELINILKLYKPSLRKALATTIKGRYTPELVFEFDKPFEKQNRLEALIEKTKEEQQDQEIKD